jgi:cell division protein FtsZ
MGVLTVGVVTKPFQFEGTKRMRQAEEGIERLQKVVDTLIIIPNQNLFRLATENTTFTEAFALADDVLYQGVKGVTDLMVRPGLINLDFADVRAVMDEMGKAMMGTGEAEGEDRATHAAEKAIANPLLDEISLHGAKGVLINITGGYDMTLFELDEAANIIRDKVDPEANIIVGSTLDPEMGARMRVSVVATGIDAVVSRADEAPLPRRSMAAPLRERVAAEEPRVAPRPAPLRPQPALARAALREAPASFEPAPQPEAALPEPRAAFEAMEAPAEVEATAEFGLPAPAYRPREAAEAPAMPAPAAGPGGSRPAAGTPTPEALARLRAMASRASEARAVDPRAAEPRAADPRAADPRAREARPLDPRATAAPREGAPRDAAARDGERPRFGINSFLNRMTGNAAVEQAAPRPAPQASPLAETEPDRADIPAFLRRQAN